MPFDLSSTTVGGRSPGFAVDEEEGDKIARQEFHRHGMIDFFLSAYGGEPSFPGDA
jgi:hypothetical protein